MTGQPPNLWVAQALLQVRREVLGGIIYSAICWRKASFGKEKPLYVGGRE